MGEAAIYTTAAQEVLNEVEVMKGVEHQNIARLFEIVRDEEEEKLYLCIWGISSHGVLCRRRHR